MTVATEKDIKIYDIKHKDVIESLLPEDKNEGKSEEVGEKGKKKHEPKYAQPMCLQWN